MKREKRKDSDRILEPFPIEHPNAEGGPYYRQRKKIPEWHHLWRPPAEPAPVRHLVKDGKPTAA